MRRKGCSGFGLVAVAFGAGLIISHFCTSGFIIALLTVAVIILGILCKC